jgi:hypothetical protein
MSFFDEIKERPWNSYYFQMPGWFEKYPTMLTLEEMRMLSWIAGNTPMAGDILDLGAFLGGSTASLAHGVRSSKKTRTIHSFDRFEFDESAKFTYLYKKGHGFYEGSDSLPLFQKLTEGFKGFIKSYKGDITKAPCPTDAIAILFVDLSKSWAINDYLLKTYFTKLKAGAIIVQQDFLFFRNPWLYPTMKKLAGKVDLLSYTQDNSVVYGVREDLTEADVKPCLAANTSQDETRDALVSTKALFPEKRQRDMIDATLAAFNAKPNAKAAWELPNAAGIKVRSLD